MLLSHTYIGAFRPFWRDTADLDDATFCTRKCIKWQRFAVLLPYTNPLKKEITIGITICRILEEQHERDLRNISTPKTIAAFLFLLVDEMGFYPWPHCQSRQPLPRCRKLGYLGSKQNTNWISLEEIHAQFPNQTPNVVVFTRLSSSLQWIWAPLGTISPGARLINIDNKQIKCLGRIRICSGYVSICWGHSTWAVNRNWEFAKKKTGIASGHQTW